MRLAADLLACKLSIIAVGHETAVLIVGRAGCADNLARANYARRIFREIAATIEKEGGRERDREGGCFASTLIISMFVCVCAPRPRAAYVIIKKRDRIYNIYTMSVGERDAVVVRGATRASAELQLTFAAAGT